MQTYTSQQYDEASDEDFLPFKCDYCSGSFLRKKRNIRRGELKYVRNFCSTECQFKAQIKKFYKPCGTCGKLTKSKFCSHSCAAKFSNKHRIYSKDRRTKDVMCYKCGLPITVNIRTSQKSYICENCKYKKRRKCMICGELRCKNPICLSLRGGMGKSISKLGFNIPANSRGATFSELEKVKIFLKNEILTKSNFEICSEFDIQPRSLYKILISLGIKEKSDKTFHSGMWHETWDGKKVYLRSSLELKQAKILDSNKTEYFVESLSIPYKNSKGLMKIYRPDFYIPSKNLIIESKGAHFEDENCKLKADASRALGYNYLYILDGKEKSI